MKKEQKTETMPRISAHIANAIELSELEAKLDCCVKELLADKVQGIIVRLRKNENAEISGNPLIAMLEELLKKEPADKKKQKLKETYGINMDKETERRLNTMCSLGERYYEQGIQQGIQRGQIQILADMIHDKLINVSEAAKRMGITEKEFLDRLQAENGSR